MFQPPTTARGFVIRCKKCGENIPAPIETLPTLWIAAKCPLCAECRRYQPDEIFEGRVSCAAHKLAKRGGKLVMFDPDAGMPLLNLGLVYLGACLIAGVRLARESQVNIRVIPTSQAIDESVDLARSIFDRVFRRVHERIEKTR